MHSNYHSPKLLTEQQQYNLLKSCTSKKYKVIILLMLDCGIRVTEAVRLQLKHFNFMENYVIIESLKKRGKNHQRQIPLTQRLLDALSTYWQELKSNEPDSYLFPPSSQSKQKHLSRKQVWRKIKKTSNGQVYPHMLRHTFATRIVNNGNELRIAKELLGHKSIATTESIPMFRPIKSKQQLNQFNKIHFSLDSTEKWFQENQFMLFQQTKASQIFILVERMN